MLFSNHYSDPSVYFHFNVNLNSTSQEINQFVNDLAIELMLNKRNFGNKLDFLNVLILNLIQGYYSGLYFSISKSKPFYTQLPIKYRPDFYKYSVVNEVLDSMADKGYVNMVNGSFNKKTHNGIQTRYAASDKLINKILGFTEINIVTDIPKEGIILHDSNKCKIDYIDTNEIIQARKDLLKYNLLRNKSIITLDKIPVEKFNLLKTDRKFVSLFLNRDISPVKLSLRKTFAKRVFNISFARGGRFYSTIETIMNKELRPHILINGNAICEIDYVAMHVRMLYHQMGIDYRNDPYDLRKSSERKIFKIVAMALINAQSKKEAIKAIRSKLVKDNLGYLLNNLKDSSINQYISLFEKMHYQICNRFYTSPALELMNIDSEIANNILKSFTESGILVLCVHDSFIIESKYKSALTKKMRAEYKRIMKFNPVVKYTQVEK